MVSKKARPVFLLLALIVLAAASSCASGGYSGSAERGVPHTSAVPVQVVVFGDMSMAVMDDGSLWGWGWDVPDLRGGARGIGIYSQTPVHMMDNVAYVSAAARHMFVLTGDGALRARGCNAFGQLGDGTTRYRSSLVYIMDDIAAVSTSWNHTIAVTTGGEILVWGDYSESQQGVINEVRLPDGAASFSSDGRRFLAINEDNAILSWGNFYLGYTWWNNALYKTAEEPVKIFGQSGFSPNYSAILGRWQLFRTSNPARTRYLAPETLCVLEYVFHNDSTFYRDTRERGSPAIIGREVMNWEFAQDGSLLLHGDGTSRALTALISRNHNSSGVFSRLVLSADGFYDMFIRAGVE